MKISNEQLDEVESFAGSFMSVEDIAVILEIDQEEVLEEYNNKESELYKRYQKGFLQSKALLNKSILELALRNSSPAQTESLKLLKQTALRNKKYE